MSSGFATQFVTHYSPLITCCLLFTARLQVLYSCNVEAWMQQCFNVAALHHPQAAPTLQFPKVADNADRIPYGEPWTSQWQEQIESLHFPNGLPDGIDIVGCVHTLDITDMQSDGSRKAFAVYGAPMGISKESR